MKKNLLIGVLAVVLVTSLALSGCTPGVTVLPTFELTVLTPDGEICEYGEVILTNNRLTAEIRVSGTATGAITWNQAFIPYESITSYPYTYVRWFEVEFNTAESIIRITGNRPDYDDYFGDRTRIVAFPFTREGITEFLVIDIDLSKFTAPPRISTSSVPHGMAGVDFRSMQFAGELEDNRPGNWTADTALPPGLTLSPGGYLSGRPTEPGRHTFTIRVTDPLSDHPTRQYGTRDFTIEVFPGTGMVKMNAVAASPFWIGTPAGQHSGTGEQRRHVTLTRDFYIARTTVTQGQWLAVMNEWHAGGIRDWTYNSNPADPNNRWRAYNYPVVNRTFNHILVFANRLSVKSGLEPVFEMLCGTCPGYYGYALTGSICGEWTADTARWGAIINAADHSSAGRWRNVRMNPNANGYRLPTEAQWEFAARAGTDTPFSDSTVLDHNDILAIRRFAWLGDVGMSLGPGRPRAVASLNANPWGLYDMHGNVQEFVWNRWSHEQYAGTLDPEGPAYLTAENTNMRVFRGGAYDSTGAGVRSAARTQAPQFAWRHDRGFRLIRMAD